MQDDPLGALRIELDSIDSQILEALAKRFALCQQVAEHKKTAGMPMMQPARVEFVRKRVQEIGAGLGLRQAFVDVLYSTIIAEACQLEDAILAE